MVSRSLFVLVVACLVMLLVLATHVHSPIMEKYADARPSKAIFTCSTYFSKPNKFEQFCRALDSIQEKDMIGSFVVVNEFDGSDPNLHTYKQRVQHRYPYVKFIQKAKEDKGQARTMNMILDMIADSEFIYWIHWEESWDATHSFVSNGIAIMERDTSITQLQLTPDWRDVESPRLSRHTNYIRVAPHHDTLGLATKDVETYNNLVHTRGHGVVWPLYSLRPSINRVAHYKGLPHFPEDPKYWPVVFEYVYGVEWLRRGAVKAMIEPPVAERQPGHVSTYVGVTPPRPPTH